VRLDVLDRLVRSMSPGGAINSASVIALVTVDGTNGCAKRSDAPVKWVL
jgi:hypothetical protein